MNPPDAAPSEGSVAAAPGPPGSLAVSTATLEALELPAFLSLIAALAASDLGHRRILGRIPLAAGPELDARRQRFEEAGRLLLDGVLVPSIERPLAPLLERLGGGRPLAGRELLELAALLEAASQAASRIHQAQPSVPTLAAATEALPDASTVLERLRRTLDRRGQVREDATPELARLRRTIRRQRDTLYQSLQALAARHRDHLSEETVPMRDGRLLLVLQAGSRGRVPGLTHGRSATGKSVYFEPLEVVEGNNLLQQAWEDEEAEKARILAELQGLVARNRPVIEAHADLLAELDVHQAAHAFARRCSGALAELGGAQDLRLVGARHPLLEPTLAGLREEALGEAGHRGPVVPLDFELTPDRRALVITGPNAGGKTVALKTAGLVALASHCGLPTPVAPGTRVPALQALVATVGDEQDLLADRSTFSGRLLRLREAWDRARPGSLLLLDELGSGTDPEEGGALAGALLEGLLERGPLVVVTTHLVPLAGEAMERPGAFCATMELDPDTGEPRYRLLPGPPGGSEALALARRLGLAPELLAGAEARMGQGGRDYRRLLGEVERLRRELGEELAAAAAETRRRARERELLDQERVALESERRSLAQRLKKDIENFRRQVRGQLEGEVERLREELNSGRRRKLAGQAAERLFADAPRVEVAEEPAGEEELVVGAMVRHRALGWQGVLERLERGRATVTVQGKRLRCGTGDLVTSGPAPPRFARAGPAPGLPEEPEVPGELLLIGARVEPALERLDEYLDQSLRCDRREVRVVHGHGSGRLRAAVRKHLRGHRAVEALRPGEEGEGGDGATVVLLRGE